MADNLDITAGTGTTIKTDDIGGIHYQQVKLVDGTLDAVSIIAADIGTKANALRIAPANNITDATYIGDVKFGEALPSGTNAIGKLAANTGIDIGDVTINNANGAAAVNIQDGGNIITVDGSIALTAADGVDIGNVDVASQPVDIFVAEDGALGKGVLLQGDDGTDRKNIAVDANGYLQVDIAAESASVTVDQATASNLKTEPAGNVAHDTADSGSPVKVGGKAVNTDGTVPGTAVAENDRANFITDLYGRQCVNTVHPNFWSATATYAGAQTATEIKAAPGAGLSLYITDVIVSNGATAGNIKFLEDTGTPGADKIEIMYFAANGGAVIHFRTPIKLTANKNFGITSITCTTHSVTVNGYIAP